MDGKICSRCGEWKPRSEFSPQRLGAAGLRVDCKECRNRVARERWASDPSFRRRHRESDRKCRYGISVGSFDALLASQGGGCAVCEGPATKKGWCVDHDHESGRVRGIVCHPCNLLLGFAGDDPDRLRSALAYLESSPAGLWLRRLEVV